MMGLAQRFCILSRSYFGCLIQVYRLARVELTDVVRVWAAFRGQGRGDFVASQQGWFDRCIQSIRAGHWARAFSINLLVAFGWVVT